MLRLRLGTAVSYQRLSVTVFGMKCGVKRLIHLRLLNSLLTGHGLASPGLHSSTFLTTLQVLLLRSLLKLDRSLWHLDTKLGCFFLVFPQTQDVFPNQVQNPSTNQEPVMQEDRKKWQGCRLNPTSLLPLPLFAKQRVRRHALCTGLHTRTHMHGNIHTHTHCDSSVSKRACRHSASCYSKFRVSACCCCCCSSCWCLNYSGVSE